MIFKLLMVSLAFAVAPWAHLYDIEIAEQPESVLVDENLIFVSDMGKADDRINVRDGNVYKIDFEGKEIKTFKPDYQFRSPMGMAIVGDLLALADVSDVVFINAATGEFDSKIDLSPYGADFLNDIVSLGNDRIAVSATNLKKIFIGRSDLGYRFRRPIDLDYQPNGLAFDAKNKILYSAGNKVHTLGEEGNGVIEALQLNHSEIGYTRLFRVNYGKFIDGIVIDGNSLLVSEWGGFGNDGLLYILDRENGNRTQIVPLETPGFADFDISLKSLVAPDLLNGRIRFFKKPL